MLHTVKLSITARIYTDMWLPIPVSSLPKESSVGLSVLTILLTVQCSFYVTNNMRLHMLYKQHLLSVACKDITWMLRTVIWSTVEHCGVVLIDNPYNVV